ncbi:MAG: DUF748 domain-containing protein, partial [Bacteroidia bacterium]|nr:DUF748 domain-containing protein [Bacteroidia bacterium]
QVDLAARRVSVKEISLQGGDVALWRTPKGAINLAELTASGNEGAIRREITKAQKTAEAEQHPWSIHLDAIRMEAFGLQLSDRSLKKPKRYRLKDIALQVTDFKSPPKTPFDFKLGLNIAEGGKAAIKGRVDMQAPSVTLSIKADDVALTPLKPYLSEFLIPELNSGNLFIKGDVTYRKDKEAEDVLNSKAAAVLRNWRSFGRKAEKRFWVGIYSI